MGGRSGPSTIAVTPLGRKLTLVRPYRGKRLIDILAGMLLLALLSPVWAMIAFLVKATSRGSVFFRDCRLGRGGVPYRMWKFRTMRVGAPPLLTGDGKLIVRKKDPRLTPVGRWLRILHLDEIPQLLNVLTGEMSFVGPRSGRPEYEGSYNDDAYERLRVLPGITGLAAVLDARHMSNESLYAVEAAYVRNQSFWLDLAIVILTPVYVVSGVRIPRRLLRKAVGGKVIEAVESERSEA